MQTRQRQPPDSSEALAGPRMIAWFTGAESPSVPIAQWTAVLEHELRAELNLRADQSLGIEFIDLPSAVLPSEFEDEAVLEAIFNFVSALRLPAAANRFLFIVTGASTHLVLVRRTAQTVDVSTLALERHTGRAQALRALQCKAACRRTGLLVVEQVSSSRFDLRQPSAAQCMAALLGDHFRLPVTAQRLAMPLVERIAAERAELDSLIAALARERAALSNGRALTGLCHLYLCDATNIAVCNDLIEEAIRFAERLDDRNGAEELARLAALAVRYVPRLRNCSTTPHQLVAIVRDIARQLFGADVNRAG